MKCEICQEDMKEQELTETEIIEVLMKAKNANFDSKKLLSSRFGKLYIMSLKVGYDYFVCPNGHFLFTKNRDRIRRMNQMKDIIKKGGGTT